MGSTMNHSTCPPVKFGGQSDVGELGFCWNGYFLEISDKHDEGKTCFTVHNGGNLLSFRKVSQGEFAYLYYEDRGNGTCSPTIYWIEDVGKRYGIPLPKKDGEEYDPDPPILSLSFRI